jgi:hypothetical protein
MTRLIQIEQTAGADLVIVLLVWHCAAPDRIGNPGVQLVKQTPCNSMSETLGPGALP